MNKGEFGHLHETGQYQINLIYFFFSCAMLTVVLTCYALSSKYSVASEFVIPCFAILNTVICAPFWFKPLTHVITIEASRTYNATSNVQFLINYMMGTFFTSNYALSVGARSLFTLNYLNIVLRL